MRILIPVDDHPLSETILRFLAARPGLLRKSPRIELVNVQLPMPRAISERFGDEAVSRVLSEEGERVEGVNVFLPETVGRDVGPEAVVGVGKAVIADVAEGCDEGVGDVLHVGDDVKCEFLVKHAV